MHQQFEYDFLIVAHLENSSSLMSRLIESGVSTTKWQTGTGRALPPATQVRSAKTS